MPHFPLAVVLINIFDRRPEDFFTCHYSWAILALVLIPFAYYLLYKYLSVVIPDSFGIRQPCCFCLTRNRIDDDKEEPLTDESVNPSAALAQLA